jgi:hypothetical protein
VYGPLLDKPLHGAGRACGGAHLVSSADVAPRLAAIADEAFALDEKPNDLFAAGNEATRLSRKQSGNVRRRASRAYKL